MRGLAEPSPEEGDEAPVSQAPAPSKSWGRRLLRWGARGLGALGLLGLVAAGVGIWPYVRDDLVLDRVVLAVALDWRDFGRDTAQARLEYELDHQGIGLQVGDEDCALTTEAQRGGEIRRVRCEWSVEVAFPLLELSLPLEFTSAAEIDAEGSLRAAR